MISQESTTKDVKLVGYIKYSFNTREAPEILISVTITSDLKVHAYVHRTQLSCDTYKDLIPTGKLSKISQLINLLALCKSMIMEPGNPNICSSSQQKLKHILSLTIQILHRFLNEHLASQNAEASQAELVRFITEAVAADANGQAWKKILNQHDEDSVFMATY